MYKIKIVEDPRDSVQREQLLMEALQNFRPEPEASFPAVRHSEKGKPYVDGGPEFSISHSGGLWGCVVSDGPCGFDLQRMRPAACDQLAARFFFPAEARYIKEAGLCGFYELWTRREALAKYTGLGFFGMSFDRPPLVDGEGKPARRVLWEGETVVFEEIEVPEGFLAVWCCKEGKGK